MCGEIGFRGFSPHARQVESFRRAWRQAAGLLFLDKPNQACGMLEFAALLYLSLPLFIFFASFTRLAVSLPALVAILAVLYRVGPQEGSAKFPRSLSKSLLCVATSGLFLWSCAYLPPFGHTWDWLKHFAILNELSQNSWPPINEGTRTFLRYNVGYYLVPGLLARLFGDRLIEVFVFIQTWIGLYFVLALLLQKIQPSRPAMFLVLFLLFSGLNLIGWFFFGHDPSIFAHKEWWATSNYAFAYDGNATLFLWVPQHALAGMIGVLLLLSDREQPVPPQALSLLGAAVLLWSPFAALGLVPFAFAAAVRSGREAFSDWGNILCGLVLGVPLLAYLLAGTSSLPHGANWNHDDFFIGRYASFMMLEVGFYLMALWWCDWRYLRHPIIVVTVLLLLPLYRIGIYNDFTMRTCIPAMTLLAIATATSLTEAKDRRCIPLAMLMFIGSVTSVLEIIGRGREGYVPAREQSLRTGPLAQEPYVMQYNAPIPNWVLRGGSD